MLIEIEKHPSSFKPWDDLMVESLLNSLREPNWPWDQLGPVKVAETNFSCLWMGWR